MSDALNELLSLIQIARRAREARSVEALGFVMVNESLQVLRYRQAALCCVDAFGVAQITAVSGLPQANSAAPYTQWLNRLCRHRMAQSIGQTTHAFRAADLQGPQAAEIAEEWREWLPEHLLWLPLKVGEDASQGALILAADQAWADHDVAIGAELVSSYAHALHALHHTGRKRGQWLHRLRRRSWIVAAAILLAIFPVRQNVLAPAEVQAKDAFVVRAPQDGVIDRVLVRPNQSVAVGTPLLNLDQTALAARHAIARQAYEGAREEYRQSAQVALTDDRAKLEMAMRRAAMEQKNLEMNYSAELLGRVQVLAEVAGVAVIADANEWQGRAVQLGERILAVADPQKVELAIQLPVGERFNVAPGTRLSLYPNANPLSAIDAVVSEVAYSAEPTRDGQMAYLLKAEFNPAEAVPRIGLTGTASLHGTRVPLIYYALRRPLTSLRQWLGI